MKTLKQTLVLHVEPMTRKKRIRDQKFFINSDLWPLPLLLPGEKIVEVKKIVCEKPNEETWITRKYKGQTVRIIFWRRTPEILYIAINGECIYHAPYYLLRFNPQNGRGIKQPIVYEKEVPMPDNI